MKLGTSRTPLILYMTRLNARASMSKGSGGASTQDDTPMNSIHLSRVKVNGSKVLNLTSVLPAFRNRVFVFAEYWRSHGRQGGDGDLPRCLC